jgi:hypothetical protein
VAVVLVAGRVDVGRRVGPGRLVELVVEGSRLLATQESKSGLRAYSMLCCHWLTWLCSGNVDVLTFGVFGASEDIVQANVVVPVGLIVVTFPSAFIHDVHPRHRTVTVPGKAIAQLAPCERSSTNREWETGLTVSFVRPSPFQIRVFGASIRRRIGISAAFCQQLHRSSRPRSLLRSPARRNQCITRTCTGRPANR